MGVKTAMFVTYLNDKLLASETYLPLDEAARADLLSILPAEDDYIYLSLKGDTHYETVCVTNRDGTLVVERGLEGTEAVTHHYATCVSSVNPTIIATVKDLICNYDGCCEGDCPGNPVKYEAQNIPDAHIGVEWTGLVIFSGDVPMTMGVSNLPRWMKAEYSNHLVKLSGVPTMEGTYTLSVAATNLAQSKISVATTTVTVVVTA